MTLQNIVDLIYVQGDIAGTLAHTVALTILIEFIGLIVGYLGKIR